LLQLLFSIVQTLLELPVLLFTLRRPRDEKRQNNETKTIKNTIRNTFS